MDEQRISRESVQSIIKDVEERVAYDWSSTLVSRLATALLTADDALKSGCVGCQNGWLFDRKNALGEPLHAVPDSLISVQTNPDGEKHWAVCTLNDQQRAAMLPMDGVQDATK